LPKLTIEGQTPTRKGRESSNGTHFRVCGFEYTFAHMSGKQ